jgi:interleukin-1 receptor-associated kinase 1
VYKGTLRDGRVVAIKRCNKLVYDERQQREFGKELLILSQVNHRSIVKLYGCCLEVEVPMLVYQFIPNGTLYQLIHGGATPPFTVRLKIAQEAAEALAYLHSMASPPIIHGDVKSPNILLDENYNTKVSDFGASALAPTDEAHLVTLVQGTCGYLDPEYLQTCRLTDKSDVYSFGVVLLELLTRRKALTLTAPEEERSLVAHFLVAMRDGRLSELLDVRIKGEVMGEVLEMVAMLAKRCLEMSSEKRPSMCEVTEQLERIRKLCECHHPCLGEI